MLVKDTHYNYYIERIKDIPLLSREDEFELAVKARAGDLAAKNTLIQANLKFVIRMARNYRNKKMPLMDLISEGNMGLMQAIDLYEPEKGVRLISYAAYWIKQRMIKALAEKGNMARIPVKINNALVNLKKEANAHGKEDYSSANMKELFKKMGMNEQTLWQVMPLFDAPVYLETEDVRNVAGSKGALKNTVEDNRLPPPEEVLIQKELIQGIRQQLNSLKQVEKDVLKRRFGIQKSGSQTLQSIAEEKGLSKERIRQIEKQALEHLKKNLILRYLNRQVMQG